jgi:propanol-preferring alcohol dehydrogenase
VETVKQLTEGRGTDLAIDAAGAQAAELSALNSVRMCGKVLFIGTNPTGKLEIDIIQQLMNRDITLIGTFYFAKDEFKEIISFLLREKDELMKIVTHRFPLEKIDEAFRLFEMKKTLRVLIKP